MHSGGEQQISPELRAEIARQMDAVFEPRVWGALLGSPADAALAITGNEKRWNLSENERLTLGACGSTFARTLAITNPRALAGLMLAAGLFSAYVPRLTGEVRDLFERKRKAAEAVRKQPAPAVAT